jgi:hypothetical protein
VIRGRGVTRSRTGDTDAGKPYALVVAHRLSLLRRLVADATVLDAQALQSNVERHDAAAIDSLTFGQMATVAGRLKSVVYTPRQTVPTFTAELFDGSGSVELVFLGRRRIAGLEPGRTIVARGRIGEHDGHKAIYNPWYVLREPM